MRSLCLNRPSTCRRLLTGAVMMHSSDLDRDTQRALLSLDSVAMSLRDWLLLIFTESSTSLALNGAFVFVSFSRKSYKQLHLTILKLNINGYEAFDCRGIKVYANLRPWFLWLNFVESLIY